MRRRPHGARSVAAPPRAQDVSCDSPSIAFDLAARDQRRIEGEFALRASAAARAALAADGTLAQATAFQAMAGPTPRVAPARTLELTGATGARLSALRRAVRLPTRARSALPVRRERGGTEQVPIEDDEVDAIVSAHDAMDAGGLDRGRGHPFAAIGAAPANVVHACRRPSWKTPTRSRPRAEPLCRAGRPEAAISGNERGFLV